MQPFPLAQQRERGASENARELGGDRRMQPKDIQTTHDVVRWLRHYVEWRETSRDMMIRAVDVLTKEGYPSQRVRPGHHAPCPAMLDSEAVCTCGQ